MLEKIKEQMKPESKLYVKVYQAPKKSKKGDSGYPGHYTKGGTCWQNLLPLSF